MRGRIEGVPVLGARWTPGTGVDFRVWAPDRHSVALLLQDEKPLPMQRDRDGFWMCRVPEARPGMLYRYQLDADPEQSYPDPASRYQPQGPEGPSEIVDAAAFGWSDTDWPGVTLPGQILYEVHIGTFSEAGTFEGARGKLPHLADLGVTMIELMPLAEFAGDFGWGYDGVYPYAPYSRYGRPDDLRRFVDAAHSLGIAVILDVVYNHFGPSGNHMSDFCEDYFARVDTEWGTAINYDGPRSGPVREYICCNAAHWIREYHIDGLRLDATQSMFDRSQVHVVKALTLCAREAAGQQPIVMIAENEPQDSDLLRPVEAGGSGLDGVWNDDFHHSALVLLTGRREAYFSDYFGRAQEMLAVARHGFLYQGQRYLWQGKRRGRSTRGIPSHAFIAYLENHDQVANGACARRTRTSSHPGAHRVLTAALLLGPWTPLLFQGQEWGTTRPFPFFAHHDSELAWMVQKGRREFLAQFPSLASRHAQESVPPPSARETFESAKLDWSGSLRSDAGMRSLALHRDLLELRRTDPVLRTVSLGRGELDGAVLNDHCWVLRLGSEQAQDERVVVFNTGAELRFSPCPEPLLAPPAGHRWKRIWSSDDLRYGGPGVPEDDEIEKSGWSIPAYAALLLVPVAEDAHA